MRLESCYEPGVWHQNANFRYVKKVDSSLEKEVKLVLGYIQLNINIRTSLQIGRATALPPATWYGVIASNYTSSSVDCICI